MAVKSRRSRSGARGQLGPGGRGPAEAPLGAGDDPLAPHEPGDAMPPSRDALRPELLVDARRAIGPPAGRVRRANVHEQGGVALGLTRGRAPHPRVEAAGGDAQHPAEAPHPELGAMGGDEVELHFWSSAKYAKAFFRMSRSSVTARSRCWSWRICSAWGASRPVPGKGSLGFSPELGPPALQQAAGDPEIVGHLVDAAARLDQGDRVLLELRREGATDPRGLLGHGTLLLESTY